MSTAVIVEMPVSPPPPPPAAVAAAASTPPVPTTTTTTTTTAAKPETVTAAAAVTDTSSEKKNAPIPVLTVADLVMRVFLEYGDMPRYRIAHVNDKLRWQDIFKDYKPPVDVEGKNEFLQSYTIERMPTGKTCRSPTAFVKHADALDIFYTCAIQNNAMLLTSVLYQSLQNMRKHGHLVLPNGAPVVNLAIVEGYYETRECVITEWILLGTKKAVRFGTNIDQQRFWDLEQKAQLAASSTTATTTTTTTAATTTTTTTTTSSASAISNTTTTTTTTTTTAAAVTTTTTTATATTAPGLNSRCVPHCWLQLTLVDKSVYILDITAHVLGVYSYGAVQTAAAVTTMTPALLEEVRSGSSYHAMNMYINVEECISCIINGIRERDEARRVIIEKYGASSAPGIMLATRSLFDQYEAVSLAFQNVVTGETIRPGTQKV